MVYVAFTDKPRAEEARRWLVSRRLLAPGYAPVHDEEHGKVGFPVVRRLEEVDALVSGVRRMHLPKRPEPLPVRVPYDVVGGVALIKEGFRGVRYASEASKIMAVNKNISTVYVKVGAVSGVERVPRLKLVAGRGEPVTVHRENGLSFKLDVERTYFNPRLATERRRLACEVGSGDYVLDMFTGVGPFAVTVAKFSCARVDAVDVNPVAYSYLVENIHRNRVGHAVTPFLCDAAAFSSDRLYSQVIMNLPFSSLNYLGVALRLTRPGAVIHVYSAKPPSEAEPAITAICEDLRGEPPSKITWRPVFEYAPRREVVRFDVHL
ncbi:MAG: methyltransferase [Candidatus Marsarchaeota archaeon]|nr:methyltransferase [Candidatus Marsarchaeota archaeon]